MKTHRPRRAVGGRHRPTPNRLLAGVARPFAVRRRPASAAPDLFARYLQRRVAWQESSRNNMDLVDTVVNGADFGFTHIMVNGRESQQHAPTPLVGPALDVQRAHGQVELKVAAEADNTLGTVMDLPTAPPWTRDVDKARVGGRLLGEARDLGKGDEIMPYVFGEGQTRLRVKGDPSDGALSRLTKQHEQHHVDDDKAAKEQIVDPWDARIATRMRAGTTYVGANPEAALQNFHAAVGGSPAAIGRDYMAECVRLGNAFHGTDPGSKPTMTKLATTSDQSSIEVSWKHPVKEGLLSKWFG